MLRYGLAGGIGLCIALLGLQSSGSIVGQPAGGFDAVLRLDRIDPGRLDPRLSHLHGQHLRQSRAVVLNLDYPLGFCSYHILTEILSRLRDVRGVFILGKSAAMIGRLGDVLIPTEVRDGHSGNLYLLRNCFTARHLVPFLNDAAVFDDQRSVTVRGTFLHSRETIRHFQRQDFTDIEMEAGPCLTALHARFGGSPGSDGTVLHVEPPPGFHIGLLHYTSDVPYSVRASLLSSRLGLTGLEAAYAGALAILKFILEEAQRSGGSGDAEAAR
ncbi:MAG: hypothetical protein A3K19_32685 [Lentisphaerae bacterium RIFOXYB12_FULL_65_16]|nr:MAG: hypothetical protein A3K18_07880 [Lentisphaerae bacterium RIFOXYA12_64_32]OGV84453.1 MAG: hypothetical protein A3K19_32685 [Lentisphaerae bacterium RIFOXYB12_FULL_65_16]